MARVSRTLVLAALLSVRALGAQEPTPPARPIQDNSFLVEEAYNQERGVVQHISSFQRQSGSWAYSFTQEWPVGGIRHQLSYTVPVLHDQGSGTGIGDVALNYRFQLAGSGEARVAVAPRLTLLAPTGSVSGGRGTGGLGVQAVLPISIVLAPSLVTHLNAGATVTPRAHGSGTVRARTTSFGAGASAIWLARPWVNLMLESVWARTQSVNASGLTRTDDSYFISPGIRWAINFPSGLQIVPGIAYPIGLGPSGGTGYLFLYLSFEHPFSHQ